MFRHREGGLELEWDTREMKLGKISRGPDQVPLLRICGSKLEQAAMLRKKKTTERERDMKACWTSEVCWLLHLFLQKSVTKLEIYGAALFLMDINSCLTILPSDVFGGREGIATARGIWSEDSVAVEVIPMFTPISLEEIAGITHQSYSITCCFWNLLAVF